MRIVPHRLPLLALLLTTCLVIPRPAFGQAPTPEPTATSAPTAVATATPLPATATPSTIPPLATTTAQPTASGTTVPGASPTASATTTAAPVLDARPFLVVVGYGAQPNRPAPGATFRLELHLSNEGDADARNVQLGLTSETFLPAGQGSVLFEDKIRDGEDETMGADLVVSQTAAPGVHVLSLDLRYEDRDGNVFTDRATVGIEVASGGTRRPLVVVAAVHMPSRVAPGIPFTLGLDLVNNGGLEARNVLVSPATGPLAFHGGGGSTPLAIPPSGGVRLDLRLVAASPSQPGAAAQTLDLRYDGPDGVSYAGTHVVGLVITGGAATDPLPMVVGYRAGNRLGLHPGQEFELELDIANVGVADALRTVLALGGGVAPRASGGTAGGAGGGSSGSSLGVFAPLETSNVRYLGRVGAGETTSLVQRMVVDGAAKPGPYVLELTFSYVDLNGQALSNTEVISLVVSRQVVLAIAALTEVTSLTAGRPEPFPVEVLNQGGSTVKVTTIEMTGSAGVRVQEGTRYVGELDSGASDALEPLVTAGEAGPAELTVSVRYLDDLNNEQVVNKVFSLIVDEAPAGTAVEGGAAPAASGNLLLRILKGFLGLGASPPLPPPSAIDVSASDEALDER